MTLSPDKINQQVPSVKNDNSIFKGTVGNLKNNNPIRKRMKQYKCTKLRKRYKRKKQTLRLFLRAKKNNNTVLRAKKSFGEMNKYSVIGLFFKTGCVSPQ